MKNSSVAFKVLGLFALGFSLASFSSQAPTSQAAPSKAKKGAHLKWNTSYAAAVKEAKRTKKPIFVDFYTDWCGACKHLDQTTYVDPKFAAASKKWVLVKLNPEKDKVAEKLAAKHKVRAFPTLLLIEAGGRKLDMLEGAYPTQLLLPKMSAAHKKNGKAPALRA